MYFPLRCFGVLDIPHSVCSTDSASTVPLPSSVVEGLNASAACTLLGRHAAAAAASAAAASRGRPPSRKPDTNIVRRDADNNQGKPFLFAVGGENGVTVWLGFEGHAAATAGQQGQRRKSLVSRRRGSGSTGDVYAKLEGRGGGRLRLVGSVGGGTKGTVLASVGRFVVAAGVNVFESDRRVTAIDVTRTWVEGVGYRGKLCALQCVVQLM